MRIFARCDDFWWGLAFSLPPGFARRSAATLLPCGADALIRAGPPGPACSRPVLR